MALRDILAQFSFNTDQKKLDIADKSIAGIIGKVKAGAAAFAAFFAVGLLRTFVTELTGVADGIAKTSAELGLGVEEWQEWEHAMGMSGVSNGELRKSFLTLGKQVEDFRDGLVGAQDLFNKLEIKDPGALPLSELYQMVGLRIAGIGDQATRQTVALQAFGKSGTKLFNLFKGGAEEVDGLKKELHDLGIITEEFAGQSEEVEDNLSRVDLAFRGVKISILSAFLPWIIRGTEAMYRFVSSTRKMVGDTNLGKAALVLLGAALVKFGTASLIAGAKMLAPWLPMIALIALAVVAVDELITTFEGGDTLIRRAIDGAFGEGTTQKIVDNIKKWGGAISDFLKGFVKSETFWKGVLGTLIALLVVVAVKFALVAAAAIVAGAAMLIPWIPVLIIIGLIATAIALVVATIWTMIKAFGGIDKIQEDLAYFWNDIKTKGAEAFSAIADWATSTWDSISSGVSSAWNTIVDTISGAIGRIKEMILSIPGVGAVLDGVKSLGSGAVKVLTEPVRPLSNPGTVPVGGSSTSNTTNNTAAPVVNVSVPAGPNAQATAAAIARKVAPVVASATNRGLQNTLVPKGA